MPAKKKSATNTKGTLQGAIDSVLKMFKDFAPPLQLTETTMYNGISYRRSNCLALDWIIANHSKKGGLPRGRLMEVFGPEGSGKTTVLTVMAAQIQKYKTANKVVIIDYEHAYDLLYAVSLGLDPEKTYYTQPMGENAGEAGMKLLVECIGAEDVGMVIVDSMTALVTKSEMTGDLGDANIGAVARLQSQTVKKLTNMITPNSPLIAWSSQLRDNIGVMFGSTEKVPGARALKFYASIRIDVRAKEKITDGDDIIGQKTKLKAVKNKCGRPFQEEFIDLMFGEGYNNIEWLMEKAESLNLLNKVKSKISLPFLPEAVSENQLTELLTKKEHLYSLYDLCVDANNLRLEQESQEQASQKEEESTEEEESEGSPF